MPVMVNSFKINANNKLKVGLFGAENRIRIEGAGFDPNNVNFVVTCPQAILYGFEFIKDPTQKRIRGRFKAIGLPFLLDTADITVYVLNQYGARSEAVKVKGARLEMEKPEETE